MSQTFHDCLAKRDRISLLNLWPSRTRDHASRLVGPASLSTSTAGLPAVDRRSHTKMTYQRQLPRQAARQLEPGDEEGYDRDVEQDDARSAPAVVRLRRSECNIRVLALSLSAESCSRAELEDWVQLPGRRWVRFFGGM
jgi:hypothetical protein